MKTIDIILSLVCGWLIGWLASGFLKDYGFDIVYLKYFLPWIIAIVSFCCLYIAYLIGKKYLFVFQLGKHISMGAFATVIDLKFFELLMWFFSLFFISLSPVIAKGLSFLVSTSFKYLGNKNWTFEKPEKDGLGAEITKFFMVVIIGLGIDVGSFLYFTKILGPQFGASENVWIKSSVILAALITAVWNFTGEKFLVFKK